MESSPGFTYRFECQRCSGCCRGGPGFVFFTRADLDRMLSCLSMEEKAFLDRYCRVVHSGDRALWSLNEKKNWDCVFWDKGCSIYPSRPVQCSSYPFWDRIVTDAESWEEESAHCPGIGKGEIRDPETIAGFLAGARRAVLLGPEGE